MVVSAYASDKGWLFNDLLLRFDAAGCESSFNPNPDADAYIVLRSSEAHLCPKLHKAVVQVHCLEQRWMGAPEVLNKAGAFCFTHPDQPGILQRMGVDVKKPHISRPIGSAMSFTLRGSMPDVFTVGWVGRATGMKGEQLFIDAMKRVADCLPVRVLLAGAQLEAMSDALEDLGIEVDLRLRQSHEQFNADMYRAAYHDMDVLAITSETEAGPLPLFEAMACGVPVVSTDVGWSSRMLDDPFGLVVPSNAAAVQVALNSYGMFRDHYFDMRQMIRDRQPWRLEEWITENVELAERMAG